MSSKQDTAIALRRLANLFKGVMQVADDIETLGSLENATAEVQAALDAARVQRDEVLAALEATKAQALAITEDAVARSVQMDAKAEAVMVAAKAEADALLSNAQADAKAKTAETAEKCAAAMQAAQERVDVLRVESDGLAADVRDMRAELDALSTQLADAKAIIARAEKMRAALQDA